MIFGQSQECWDAFALVFITAGSSCAAAANSSQAGKPALRCSEGPRLQGDTARQVRRLLSNMKHNYCQQRWKWIRT